MDLARWMRGGLVLASPLMIASCAGKPAETPRQPPPPAAPFYVGSGVGSEHGNYASHPDGEMIGPTGTRCITYVWDRPVNADYALRLRSASCEPADHSWAWVAYELERKLIPLANSEVDKE